MNNFGVMHVWTEGDFVIRAVAVVLIGMSLLSWTVILMKLWQQRAMRQAAGAGARRFWNAPSVAEGIPLLGPDRDVSPFRALAEDAFHANQQHARMQDDLRDGLNRSEWLSSVLHGRQEEIVNRMQRGLQALASVGSTAPFIGLLGTVWGIYHALAGIGATGQATIDKVAGPVGEALIMTALGLAVAIPAVLGYNVLARGNRCIQSTLNRFSRDLHAYLLTGMRAGHKTPEGI